MRTVVFLWCYGLVVAVSWLMGIFASTRLGVVSALVATPGLVMVSTLRWRQGRMTLVGFTGLLVAAPVVVGVFTDLEAIDDRRLTWGPVLGLGVGLVTAAVAVLVVRTEVFRTKPDVFICYRRTDSVYAVDRIHERLVRRYGRHHVFRDSDSVPPGQHVQNRIVRAIRDCDVLLAVIGPQWTTVRHRDGTPRLHLPHDYVRFELEQAFEAGVTVIPVLINDATLPDKADLPAGLRRLPDLNAVAIRPATGFANDLRSLTGHIELSRHRAEEKEPWRTTRRRNLATVALAFALLSQLVVIAVAGNTAADARTYLSPDGTRLLSTHEGAFGTPVSLWLWDTTDDHLIATAPYPGPDLRDVLWSPDSRRFATDDANDPIRLWDGSSLAREPDLPGLGGDADDVFTWSPDGTEFAVMNGANRLRVWHTPGTGPPREAAAQDHTVVGKVSELTWAPRDDLIAVTGIDMDLSVWRLDTDRLAREDQYEPVKAETARWSPTGRELAVTDSLTEDVLVLGPDGKPAATLKTGLYAAEELYWSPDSEHLAATTTIGGGGAWLWDVDTGDLRHSTTLSGPTGVVIDTTLAWSPDNANAVVAADGRLLVLSVDGTQRALRGPDRADEVARWTKDGIQVVSSPPDRTYFQVSWATPAGTWRTTTLELTPWRIATSIDLTGTPL